MNFTQFQEEMVKEVQKFCVDGELASLQSVRKNNGIEKYAIVIRNQPDILAPSIYLEGFFRQYQSGTSVRELAGRIFQEYGTAQKVIRLPEDFFLDYATVRASLFCRLVNRSKNEMQLKDMPYRPWLDLAIIYYYKLSDEVLPDYSITIKHEHLALWEISEEELFATAWSNTLSEQKAVFQTLGSAIAELQSDSEFASKGDSSLLDNPLFLLTNSEKCFGAITLCDRDKMFEIANYFDCNFYILPSSIHECLLLKDEGIYERKELEEMVEYVNRTQLSPQEILSDHVYYYDRRIGEVLI